MTKEGFIPKRSTNYHNGACFGHVSTKAGLSSSSLIRETEKYAN